MADLTKHIEQLRDDLQTSEADLETAKEAASRIPEIEGEIERLKAAMTALGAPQSPAGRKRIGDAQKKRTRGPKPPVPVTPTVEPQCFECKRYGGWGAVPPCPADSCEASVCAACLPKHNARWHQEAV